MELKNVVHLIFGGIGIRKRKYTLIVQKLSK